MLFYLIIISSAYSAIKIERNINYSNSINGDRNLLDVYYPKDIQTPKIVLVFIHGGSWNSGKKGTYWWMGRNFASENVVTVIINYSLSPKYQYEQMASDCAEAIKWVKNNVSKYGGNPDQIFTMGHSAGGHLAALINSNLLFFQNQGIPNPIKGVILNDAFGLDMYEYLTKAQQSEQNNSFLNTFSNDEEIWKAGSPFTYLNTIKTPFLIFTGGRTYPAIQIQSKRFFEQLTSDGKPTEYKIIEKKNHVQMISQMVFKGNKLYKEIISFMEKVLKDNG